MKGRTINMISDKEKYIRQIRTLFCIQCLACVCVIAAWIPVLSSLIAWVNILISIGISIVLTQLSASNKRYAKAAIFRGIVVVLSILSKFSNNSIFSLATSVLLLCSLYHEYHAHAEMLVNIDDKLSKRWKDLFSIYLLGSILVTILSSALVVALSPIFLQYATVVVGIVVVLAGGFDLVMMIVYLLYLKQTTRL